MTPYDRMQTKLDRIEAELDRVHRAFVIRDRVIGVLIGVLAGMIVRAVIG